MHVGLAEDTLVHSTVSLSVHRSHFPTHQVHGWMDRLSDTMYAYPTVIVGMHAFTVQYTFDSCVHACTNHNVHTQAYRMHARTCKAVVGKAP